MKYEFDLVERNVSWDEIPSVLCDYKDYLKTLEEIRKEEQKELEELAQHITDEL
jgi:hypothetical protein